MCACADVHASVYACAIIHAYVCVSAMHMYVCDADAMHDSSELINPRKCDPSSKNFGWEG